MSDNPRVVTALRDLRQGATSLNLNWNDIGDEGAKALAAALKEVQSLTSLDLRQNNIGDEGAKALAAALKENQSLTSLDLPNNNIGDEGAKALAAALKEVQSLTSLDLWSNNIGDEGAKALAAALKEVQSLTSLNLRENNIGDEGAKALAAALKENQSLTLLNLIGNNIGDEGAKALAAALKENQSLTSLSLRWNNIGDEGAKALAAALKENQSLTSLSLPNNNIGDEGAKALAAELKEVQSLTSLDLPNNNIGDEGAKALAAALKEVQSLTSLDLQSNKIGDEGAKALAAALKEVQSLTSLDLFGNNIGDEGAKALAAALKENQSLTSLDLIGNNIGDEGAKALAEALKENQSLTSLSLRWNNIGDEGAKALAAALKENQSLTSLDLGGDNIDDEGFEEIWTYLERNEGNTAVWRKAVEDAIHGNDEHAWGRAKLMIVGQGAAGKTSTVRSLLGRPYVAEHVSTEVADLHRTRAKDFEELPDDAQEFDMQVRKAALRRIRPEAEVKHKSIRRSIARTIRKSVKRVSSRLSGTPASGSVPRDAPANEEVLANDDEIARRFELTKDDKKMLQKASGVDASLDFDLSFTIWDYGGQEVFYALHHIFLTNMGIYLVVFDMQELLNDQSRSNAVEYLRFWLNSIQLDAPDSPIIMVGTYLDKVRDEKSLDKIARVLREDVRIGDYTGCLVYNPNGRPFYELDNSSPDLNRAAQLRQVIVDEAMKQDYVKQKVPLAWLKVHEDLLQRKKSYLMYDDVVNLAALYGRSHEDVDEMLLYFHTLGVVVHLCSTETLQRVVILEPQWLLDKLARVIADDIHVQQMYRNRDLRNAGVDKDFYRLRRDAIATHSLLEFLWEGEEVEYLIRFMRENLLLSDWVYNRKAKESEYLVSGLLSDSQRHVDTSKFKPGLTCELDFSAFYLPNGVFQRLVAQCASHAARPDIRGTAPLVPPALDQHTARLTFGRSKFLLRVQVDSIRIEIHQSAKTPATVIKVLISMFREQEEVLFKHLKWDLILIGPDSDERIVYSDLEEARNSDETEIVSVDGDIVSVEEFAPFFDENIGRLDTDEDGTNLPLYEIPKLRNDEESHVFLSHVESTGGDLAELLSDRLSHRGLKVWLSQEYHGNLNQAAMKSGVQKAHVYVLLLTKGIFASSAVCMEFQAAVDAKKPILLVHAPDPGRSSFAPFSEYINTVPAFYPDLFKDIESLPVRRRYYEQEPFLSELIRRHNQTY